jgi:hypothetical protein
MRGWKGAEKRQVRGGGIAQIPNRRRKISDMTAEEKADGKRMTRRASVNLKATESRRGAEGKEVAWTLYIC